MNLRNTEPHVTGPEIANTSGASTDSPPLPPGSRRYLRWQALRTRPPRQQGSPIHRRSEAQSRTNLTCHGNVPFVPPQSGPHRSGGQDSKAPPSPPAAGRGASQRGDESDKTAPSRRAR